jgi:hypothetical protein
MRSPRSQANCVRKSSGSLLLALTRLCVFVLLIVSSSLVHAAATVTVNPVRDWIPVVARFEMDEQRANGGGGDAGPIFTRIKSQTPGIPSAWRELEEMVRIRSAPRPSDPVISGWHPWYTPEGVSGIEAKAADPGTSSYVISFVRGEDEKVHWEVQIWGRHRLKDPDDPEKKRVLRASDPKFKKLIKEKIKVVDFSLTAHKVPPEGNGKNIRNAATEAPYQTLGTYQQGFAGAYSSLASYEAQEFKVRRRGNFIAELRLQLKLRFPEAERQQDSGYYVPLEASMRFSVGDWARSPRVISRKLRKLD